METNRRRARLLVVDDEADIRGLVVDALRAVGYTADEAPDGQKALDLLAAFRYDIVLTDLKMPGLDGLSLLARIKELYPDTDVIMFTGYATIRTSVEAMRGGAYDYLPKPFDPDDLVRAVHRCMERRALLKERQQLSEVVSLLELGRTLTNNLDLDALASEIVEQVGRVFGADWVSLFLRWEATHAVTRVAQWWSAMAEGLVALEPTPDFLRRVVSRLSSEVLFGGTDEVLDGASGQGVTEPCSIMGIPLRTAERDIGVLICARCSAGLPRYSTADGQFFSVFATQAAVALDNALRYEELQSLDQIGRRLAATLDGDQLIEETLTGVMRFVRPDTAAIYAWGLAHQADQLHVAVREGVPLEILSEWPRQLNSQFAQVAIPPGKVRLVVHHVALSARGARYFPHGEGTSRPALRSALVRPLGSPETPFGLLAVGSLEADVFTEEHGRALSTLASSASVALSNAVAYRELKELNIQTISALVNTVEARDPYTRGHSERVGRYAAAIARELGLSPAEAERVHVGGLLHDIGKIGIRDDILYKPGQLTYDEHDSMKEHPAIGARIVQGIEKLTDVVPVIYAHQERYDGLGYPEGLQGEAIPLAARIVAVADAFEAMTSERPYKLPVPPVEALRLLQEGAGSRWDPKVVGALERLLAREVSQDIPHLQGEQTHQASAPEGRPGGRVGVTPTRRR